ncbi:D-aspartate oxidase [Diabrotica virgifera virgifera]|uniref:D-aspartate oxidase-like n=1 Tax=Diabrotica virgifera virgifera TaxID=50390 RepID=A0A6P7GC92_DIAVI|nr:D-aspartate oxidase [Diabrotica virgifera virgifera]
MSDLKIAVVGSGIIGLTTGIELLKSVNNAEITIVAEGFNTDTCSWAAAGIFRPGHGFTGPNREITQKWIDDSYYYWKNIRDSVEAAEAGVTEISGYTFSNREKSIVRNAFIEKLVPIYRKATEKELTTLCPDSYKYGSFYKTLVTDSTVHLPWATNKFKSLGGKILKRHVNNLVSLGDQYDIVVNCAGLGAKKLCNDPHLTPIRGQVIKVNAPWVKMFFYAESDTYIIPGFNHVTLGGTRQYDSYNSEVDKYDGMSIRERCERLVPSLKPATEVRQVVGLRPHRTIVRVEKEILLTAGGKKVKVVHNYGHGGYGVTTAPGTSLYACDLVKEIWAGTSKL